MPESAPGDTTDPHHLIQLTPMANARDDRVMNDPDNASLLTVQQAIRIIDAVTVSPRMIAVALEQSAGLRLAENLSADRDFPPFEKSLMDGYAVRCSDVASGRAALRVVGTIAAGQSPPGTIGPGETMAIMTGAPLPGGADGVVPVEDVAARVAIGEAVQVLRATSPQRFVAHRASDCRAGQTVLTRGTLIDPAQIAVAASIGAAELKCFARPRVAILGTGDEIVPVAQTPGPSQIRDSNTPMLTALLRRLGCDVCEVASVRDNPEKIRHAIQRGMAYDALFITGGMSMGEFDYVPRLLEELDVDVKITKLRIKPGKPFVFALSNAGTEGQNCFIFGLPGNPVSAYVCTLRLASRLLARIAGGTVHEHWLDGRLDADLPANGPREFYQPALRIPSHWQHSAHAEFATITPLGWKGSADLFTLAAANVLIVRGENEPAVPKGTAVRVLEI